MSGIRRPDARVLRPGLHLLETELEDFDVRAAVLVGERGAVVWDTLAHPDQMVDVPALARGRPVTVVYSHADWDHCWGTSGLADAEEVIAAGAAAARFADDVPRDLAARRERDADVWDAVRLVPPTRTFDEDVTLDLGGVTLELAALAGHTGDCIVGWVPEWGVLLAGDVVETPLPVVNDGSAVAGWTERLERWATDARVETVVPSHGPIGGREILERNAAYLRALLEGADPVTDPGALAPFYRETHERNRRLVAEARTGGEGAAATAGA